MTDRNIFKSISPIDCRYWDEKAAEILSEEAFIRYKLRVELALVKALQRNGICEGSVTAEVAGAIGKVSAEEVYAEEKRIHHDIRALVNCIREKLTPKARPFVHMTATSFDISDTANALRFRDAVNLLIVPSLLELETVLIRLTLREADTLQIGRTHGQHAVPITFGFAMAEYVDRVGRQISKLRGLAHTLEGKFSGAVGAYNASNLFFREPRIFEGHVLSELGLKAALHSTQILPPENMARLMSEAVLTAGVLANLARDMRSLQRTEIGEVGEEFKSDQVGSSTMPQKRNPINFENVESLWKELVGRQVTLYLDQVSEHQRDLTNSASARTNAEILAYLHSMIKRMAKVMGRLRIDHGNMERNLEMSSGLVLAEPLYIILAGMGHPDAHEKVKKLTLRAQAEKTSLQKLAWQDKELASYFSKMTDEQRRVLTDPREYTGIAAERARAVADSWRIRLRIEQYKQ